MLMKIHRSQAVWPVLQTPLPFSSSRHKISPHHIPFFKTNLHIGG